MSSLRLVILILITRGSAWLDYAKQQWEQPIPGGLLNDEPGGKVIDGNWTGISHDLQISNNPAYAMHGQEVDLALNGSMTYDSQQASEAAYHFVADRQASLNLTQLRSRQIDSFTSDYALYWFDYSIGYNTIFAELGNNQSSVQAIDLVRGAARLQNETGALLLPGLMIRHRTLKTARLCTTIL